MAASSNNPQGEYDLDLTNFDISNFMHPASGGPSLDNAMFSRASNSNNNNDISSLTSSSGNGMVVSQYSNVQSQIDGQMQSHQMEQFAMNPQQSQQQESVGHSPANMYPRGMVTAETLKLQLQQQLRLQQLQQLQNQILQQQIELISSQTQQPREMLMHGLLTPTSSSELRPTVHRDFLSPMTLQGQQYNSDPNVLNSMVSPAMTPQTNASAVYQHSNHTMTPMEMFSPLTSPALGPSIGAGGVNNQRLYSQAEWSSSMSSIPTNGSSDMAMSEPHTPSSIMRGKRPMPPDENTLAARKRQSPLVKATPSTIIASAAQQQRKTRSRASRPSLAGSDLQNAAMNTPSPVDVDMSMPPPAPPAGPEPDPHVLAQNSPTASSQTSPDIEPVTPASIMNLDHSARLPTGLVSGAPSSSRHIEIPMGPMTAQQQQLAEVLTRSLPTDGVASDASSTEANRKGKSAVNSAKGKAPASGSRSTKPSPIIRPSNNGSSTPKTILPSGVSAETASQMSQKSNFQTMLESGRMSARNFTAQASASNSPVMPEKKSSHKVAEQKRRDSLKAGFDELRLLLPPIIIDPDSDEPLLPGSAPPRGPQRNLPPGSQDHPNRGVSKLALLRCSNEYIARLHKRIDRRDDELTALREEIQWLRERAGVGPGDGERELVDLDKDLDEIERDVPNLGVSATLKKINGVGATMLDEAEGSGKRTKKGSSLRSARSREKDNSIDTVDEEDEDDDD